MPDMQNNGSDILKKHLSPKKILISVVIAISVLLPTIIALASISTANNEENKNSLKIHTVILCDEHGNELAREDEETVNTETPP